MENAATIGWGINMATARQIAAARRNIKKAQEANRRRGRLLRMTKNRGKAPSRKNRGEGLKGIKKNVVPYVRANKRSQTAGFNTGTIIPFTRKRIVFGGYARLENTTKNNAFDKMLSKAADQIAPNGTRAGKIRNYFNKNVTIANPAIRAAVGGAEVRLGTSRGAGPTIILRRGRHKTSRQASYKAIKRYDTHIRKIHAARAKKKRPRPQRRGKK